MTSVPASPAPPFVAKVPETSGDASQLNFELIMTSILPVIICGASGHADVAALARRLAQTIPAVNWRAIELPRTPAHGGWRKQVSGATRNFKHRLSTSRSATARGDDEEVMQALGNVGLGQADIRIKATEMRLPRAYVDRPASRERCALPHPDFAKTTVQPRPWLFPRMRSYCIARGKAGSSGQHIRRHSASILRASG